MTALLSRRHALLAGLTATLATAPADAADAGAELAALERRHPGRLCVAILNLGTGARLAHRGDERILMCSTFKALLAAHVLARVERGEEKLERRVAYSASDLVPGSPATSARLAQGMTIAELCEATVTLSDNTAGNLLLAASGGSAALTQFLRGLGDPITRLDRMETALNYHDHAGDERDTTTANAMADTLRRLLAADALAPVSRGRLAAWLITNKTGDARLRAGFPATWIVGDKTGTTEDRFGNANDVAIAWPPDRAPVIVAAFCEMPNMGGDARNAVLAEVGRIAARV